MAELAAGPPDRERFDAFVDEGQDFSDALWPAKLAGLKDREQGGLYVLADVGQRELADDWTDPEEPGVRDTAERTSGGAP